MREVGQANEHRPRTQLAKGGRTQDVGQQPAEQIGHTAESSGTHKGSCPASVLLRVGWQLGEHLLLPSFSDESVELRRELWQGIMVRLGHQFLLK